MVSSILLLSHLDHCQNRRKRRAYVSVVNTASISALKTALLTLTDPRMGVLSLNDQPARNFRKLRAAITFP